MKRMSALTLHGSLAMCLVCALAHSEWPAGSHLKPCPEIPAPLPADFLHLIDQSCITWISYPRRQPEKAFSISSPWSGSQKKKWGEGSWKASRSKAEWFPRQLTVSMPGVGLTALTAALSSLSGRMIKRKKKNKSLDVGTWRPGSIMELSLAGCDLRRTVI